MMYSIKIINKITLFCLLLLLCWACKVSEPLTFPASQPLPTTFGATTDTVSIAQLRPQQFFTDPQLVSLIETAIQNNPDLLAAAQRVEMARASVLSAQGARLPAVQGAAATSLDRYGQYTMNGVGNYDTNLSPNIDGRRRIPAPLVPDYLLGLRSFWEVDLWGKLQNNRRAAHARFLASEKGRQLVQTGLVAAVARLYYHLVTLDDELAIVQKNIQLQQLAVELMKVQKSGGRATELAVQQFSAQLLNTQGLQARLQQEVMATENDLNRLLGRFPQPIARGRPMREQQLPGPIRAGVPARMLAHRPDVQQAELELAATKFDVAAARAAFLPSLTISPYLGLNAFKASLLFSAPASLAYGLASGLSAPLLNRKPLKSQFNFTTAASQEAYQHYQQVVLQSYAEVATGLAAIENYRRRLDLKNQEVKALQNAVNIANDLFAVGYANYLEIITAQKSVLAAELELINDRKAMFQAAVGVYRALGGGWQ